MLSLHAETPEEKRDLARTLATTAPAVLEDMKRLGVLFGPFDRIDLEINDESSLQPRAGWNDVRE